MLEPIDEVIRTRVNELESKDSRTRDETETLEAYHHVLTVMAKQPLLDQFKAWIDTDDLANHIYKGIKEYHTDSVTLDDMQTAWRRILPGLEITIESLEI